MSAFAEKIHYRAEKDDDDNAADDDSATYQQVQVGVIHNCLYAVEVLHRGAQEIIIGVEGAEEGVVQIGSVAP